MLKKVTTLMITLFALSSGTIPVQEFAVKNNLLYDVTPAINLRVGHELSPRWTLEVLGGYSARTFSDNEKTKFWMFQPGVRYWTCSRSAGYFWEVHLLGGEYNYGGMLPLGIKPSMSELGSRRYQGWPTGTGAGYGYSWVPGKRWNLEVTLGLGYAHFNYDHFECKMCGDKLGSGNKSYFGPTKAAVSSIYVIK